jgi:hypothetical protein
MLDCQIWLARTAAAWSSPVFIGVMLISIWTYREGRAAGAVALSALAVAAWIGSGVWTVRAAAALGRRREQLVDVLTDLRVDSHRPRD